MRILIVPFILFEKTETKLVICYLFDLSGTWHSNVLRVFYVPSNTFRVKIFNHF